MERSQESRDSSVGIVTGLRDRLPRSRGSIPAGATDFVFPKRPATAVGSTTLRFSRFRGLRLREEADHSPPSSARLRMRGAMSPILLMSSWRVLGHLDTWSTYWLGALLQNKTTQRNANKPRFLNGVVGLLRPCAVTVVGTSRDERTLLTEQRGKCHRTC